MRTPVRTASIFASACPLLLAGCGKAPPPAAPQSTGGTAAAAATAPAAASPHPAMAHPPASLAYWAHGAKLFDGLGTFHRRISIRSREAQAYFDQGMRFMW